MSLFIIELENMEFHAFHGCYALEQVVGNRFSVNVSIEAELDEAARRDDVAETINYLTVSDTVRKVMAVKSRILENVALRIIDAIHEQFPQSRKVRVKVSKLAPPLGGKIERVSVILEKERPAGKC